MSHIAEYLVGMIVSILVITSMFVFHKFWAKTTKTYWVRIILFAWMLGNQIYIVIFENITFDWELCYILAWSAVILMACPTKLQIDLFMPLVMVGPILAIGGGFVGTAKEFGFDHFRYWNYYFAHLGIIVSYLYIYLYDFTGARLSWQSIRRSAIFSVLLLTFVMVWNMAYIPVGTNPLESLPVGTKPNGHWGKNYIYKFIFDNLGLGYLNLLAQYFIMIFGFSWILFPLCYTMMFFARPIYANQGTEKLKFDIHEEILGIKKIVTKQNLQKVYATIALKIKG
ncbi:YwaF family protein [Williamsoniiplasma lucivorax]|uniref:Uncharacterized protein n=1 Tax=Williamsoniiplasma lucivorax TaxID=209274 RepID=A0A2S5RDW4_9MOLU|nr:YwaF family protein [Williamsoniiplasma lucivorax]PPE05494.1 hypothetical protein ELUCI_v1c05870 [Williamsoniiplasma lucivorax]